MIGLGTIINVDAEKTRQYYQGDRIQPQDAMSRHRGAKPPRRCGLLGEISLLWSRTGTDFKVRRILSPVRLPISPPGLIQLNGDPQATRTPDPLIKSQMLYQLS